MRHEGGCHCGAIRLVYESDVPPEAAEIRACQCDFCRRHASRAVSDPAGRVTLRLRDEGAVQRYRFGLGTADYLLCGRCGVYVAAVMEEEGRAWSVVILNALDDAGRFTRPPVPADFSAESREARIGRRRQRWTPAAFAD
jgi:hypothetical protein